MNIRGKIWKIMCDVDGVRQNMLAKYDSKREEKMKELKNRKNNKTVDV